MSALPIGTFIRPGRSLYESGAEPLAVGSLVGVSSINNTVYPPIAVLPEYFPSVAINVITELSTINGVAYPPAAPSSGPKILYGTIAFASNGQTVTFATPFATNPSVFLQATGNMAGFTGYFQVNNGSTKKTSFQIYYSAGLDYGPIEVNWMAVGT